MTVKPLAAAAFAMGLALLSLSSTAAQEGKGKSAAKADSEPRGLRLKTAKATPGYLLFSPSTTKTAYLTDIDGRVVKEWNTSFLPSGWIYLLKNGHILRGASDPGTSGFSGGGSGGRIQEFDANGAMVWDFVYNRDRLPHHDVAVLPNGNVLAVAWERKSPEEARRAGRRDDLIPEKGIWPDMIVEFEPQRPSGTRIVWEWHSWDHLVRTEDAAAHPEKIDVNGDMSWRKAPPNPPSDVFHTNSIAYHPGLDQIMVSVPEFNEIWVIDHRTTTAEAAGKAGDLLYRWGNPQTYGRGTAADRMFGFEHNAQWIAEGLPGAGHMSVFSNRTPRPDGTTYTKVYEFAPPIDRAGRYTLPAKGPYGPAEPVWSYSADGFNATYISGAQRLANGNTFITSGPQGRFIEVTPAGEIVWEFWSPFRGEGGSAGANGSANPYSVFRGQKITEDHPGLAGLNLR